VTTIERVLSAATAILPGTERERYRREFAAELAELRGHHRWTYVLRVLVRLPWLRRTLRAPGTPSPLLLMVTALCFVGSAASGGWAAYQRWWPTCFAPDPRSEWADPSFGPLAAKGVAASWAASGHGSYWACLNAQDNDLKDYLHSISAGVHPLLGAQAAAYLLLGLAVALFPVAVGMRGAGPAMGAGWGVALALLGGWVLIPPGMGRQVFMALTLVPVLIAPACVVALLVWALGHLAPWGLRHVRVWQGLVGLASFVGFPLQDEWVTTLVTRASPHDTAPGAGVPTAVAGLVLAGFVAHCAVAVQRHLRRRESHRPLPALRRERRLT
jgi:hypothetical protein